MSESPRGTILVVEDQPSEREAMVRLLRLEKYDVLTAANTEEALGRVEEKIDLVVSDLYMGTANDGIALLQQWKAKRPNTPFIMVTAHGEVESAVKAMKYG